MIFNVVNSNISSLFIIRANEITPGQQFTLVKPESKASAHSKLRACRVVDPWKSLDAAPNIFVSRNVF